MDEHTPNTPDKMKHNLPGKTSTIGLDYNVAGLLCYLPLVPINAIAAGVWMATEPKENKFVRFHAMQGLIIFGALLVLNVVLGPIAGILGIIPVIGGLLAGILSLAMFVGNLGIFVGMIIMMIKAYNREMYQLPVVGQIADQNS